MVRKMLPPGAVSPTALAAETGMTQSTLYRWLKEARTVGVMDKPAKKWTPAEKLRVVVEANKMSDAHAAGYKASKHHAKLAVNSAKTFADFIFDTYSYQKETGKLK